MEKPQSFGGTDLAALSASSVAAGLSMLLGEGEYDLFSVVLTATLLMIIAGAFAGKLRTKGQSTAIAAAVALSCLPAAGFLLEVLLYTGNRWNFLMLPDQTAEESMVPDGASFICWMVLLFAAYVWDRRAQRALSPTPR